MSAPIVNLAVCQYADESIPVSFTDALGALEDFTADTAELQIRKTHDASILLSLTQAAGLDLTVVGVITIVITEAQTTALPPGRYLYDLVVTRDATGLKQRMIQGAVNVSAGVTR